MKNHLFFLVLLTIGFLNQKATAQITLPQPPADTFRIQNFPLKIWYANDRIKKPKQAQSVLLAKNDAQINRDWQTSKTLRNIGLGVQILGLGVEAIGLAKSISSEEGDENNLVLKGVGIMLGGVILQVVGNGPMKRAMRRFNDLQTGRFNF